MLNLSEVPLWPRSFGGETQSHQVKMDETNVYFPVRKKKEDKNENFKVSVASQRSFKPKWELGGTREQISYSIK